MANPFKVIKGLLEAEDEVGEFIRGGPGDGFPGHVRDRFRDRCNQFANLPPWARALSGVAGGSIKRMCQPYWDDSGKDGPVIKPGYPGGQCPATYEVYATTSGIDLFIGGQTPRNLQGPLGGVTFTRTVIGNPFPDSTRFRWTFAGPNDGVEFTARGDFTPDPGFRIAGRVDAQPDNCGDQPDTIEPGPNPPADPGPLPGPEPTNNPDPDNPIPIIPVPPYVDPVFGPQPVTGPDPFGPGGGEPQPPAGGDGLPGDPDAIGGEAGEVTPGESGEEVPFGEPEEGRIWVGCIVETATDPRIGDIPGTAPTSTVWPTVRANVALKYGSYFGKSERINSKFHDIFRANTSLTVTGCFIQVQPGSVCKIFPVSALKCPENPCGESNG